MFAPRPERFLRIGRFRVRTAPVPAVMGILNVTPDSFSDGGRWIDADRAVARAHEMVREGAAIVDVGGESTRPGAEPVGEAEEIDRVVPVIERLVRGDRDHAPLDVPVSVDTMKPAVARAALEAGASLVNDVSGARDPGMVDVLRRAGDDVAVVLMHMRGTPRTMQRDPHYDDVVAEVAAHLHARAAALEAAGVARERIVLDPGIGFGKRLEDNLDLLKNVDRLRGPGYALLVGASRKSFIAAILERARGEAPPPERRLAGSLAAAAACFAAGVDVVRVHDVRETVEMLAVLGAVADPEPWRGKPVA